MHDCWLQTTGGRFRGEEPRSRSCHHDEIAAPVYHFSFMWGQGFGRIIGHGVKTCLLATLLHRSCVIDLARDKYYNLRSFIKAGPYDWEQGAQVVLAQSGVNISHALHQMPNGIEKGHGWEKMAATDKTLEYDDVMPMIWGTDQPNAKSVQQHLDLWDGRVSNNFSKSQYKTLLSPNFGDAWYAYGKEFISVSREWDNRIGRKSGCTATHMLTFLQNLMFVPTTLAYELYRERRAIVLQKERIVQNNNKMLTGVGASALPPYGAIHLRMNILNKDVYKMGVTKEQVVEGLKNCFESMADNSAIKKWWLISDDIEVAQYVSNELDSVYSFASSVEKEGHADDVKKKFKGPHSGDAINQKFGQEMIAPSVIDWMALHESHVAIITHDSAYGETGARGNGKIHKKGNTCGGRVQNEKSPQSFPMFYVFQKDV